VEKAKSGYRSGAGRPNGEQLFEGRQRPGRHEIGFLRATDSIGPDPIWASWPSHTAGGVPRYAPLRHPTDQSDVELRTQGPRDETGKAGDVPRSVRVLFAWGERARLAPNRGYAGSRPPPAWTSNEVDGLRHCARVRITPRAGPVFHVKHRPGAPHSSRNSSRPGRRGRAHRTLRRRGGRISSRATRGDGVTPEIRAAWPRGRGRGGSSFLADIRCSGLTDPA